MNTGRRPLWCCMLSAVLCICSALYGQEHVQTFSWPSDPAVLEHEVVVQELQADGAYRDAVRERTSEDSISIPLENGIYRYMITAYDLLGRPSAESQWQKLEILVPSAAAAASVPEAPPPLPVVLADAEEEPVFDSGTQRLSWLSDPAVLEYAVAIERAAEGGAYEAVGTYRTETPEIQTDLAAGDYRWRITVYDLLERESISDWVYFSVVDPPPPVPEAPPEPEAPPVTGYDYKTIVLAEREAMSAEFAVSGVQPDGQAALRSDDGTLYPVEIAAAEAASVTINAAAGAVPDGTYTLVIANEDEEPAEAATVTISHYIQPQILFVPYRHVINPMRPFALAVQTRGVPPESTVRLVSDAGGGALSGTLWEWSELARLHGEYIQNGGADAGSADPLIGDGEGYGAVFDGMAADGEGSYSIEITTPEGRTSRWSSIDIAYRDPPVLTELTAEEGLFFKDEQRRFTVRGSGFTESTVFYLLPEKESRRTEIRRDRAIQPLSQMVTGDTAELIFRAGDIPNTTVQAYADRDGQISQPSAAVQVYSRYRFEFAAGGGLQLALLQQDGGLGATPPGYYGSGAAEADFRTAAPFGFFSIIPYKMRWGYIGVEFSAAYVPWLFRTDEASVWSHLLLPSASLMYQYSFMDDLFRVGVSVGGGAGILWQFGNDERPELAKAPALFPTFSAGAEFRVQPARHFYIALRVDYTMLFITDTPDGFIRPSVGAGVYF